MRKKSNGRMHDGAVKDSHRAGPNHLAGEKSPYLLQHAYNPVDWYPWGEQAFARARREKKPIFLSIGYSTCHWCHVMEAESFEDTEVAAVLNETFVCIKVDREERPDIDNVYMNVCQLITGSGGWPLSILLTPEGKPFFAATYIPKYSRSNVIGLLDLTARIRQLWAEKHDELVESADQITNVINQGLATGSPEDLGTEELDMAFAQLSQNFDAEHGGFGETMKFPTPHNLTFLLRYWRRTGNRKALAMVERTLEAMRHGGIFDQVGLGFHRYATDRSWLTPHFEKMLYDQAMIAVAYLEAFQATREEFYGDTAREIFAYVLRDLTAHGGGFISAQDADTEGEEGKFYLWTLEQIQQVLSESQTDLVIRAFGVREEGNFVDAHTGHLDGQNILHLERPLSELADEMKLSESVVRKHLGQALGRLFAAREKRVHPGTDDKILTDWNGLMIAALAMAGRVLDDEAYTKAAKRAFDFIQGHLRRPDGTLWHRFRDGEAAVEGVLSDYAFLAWGAMELYETTFEAKYLETALQLTDRLLDAFWDGKAGGFYMTPAATSDLVIRPKDVYDGAIPAGNSVAALNLRRLARLTGRPDYEDKASAAERSVAGLVRKVPSAYTQLLASVEFAVGPSYEVVIAGDSRAKDTLEMLRAMHTQYLPNTVVLLRPTEKPSPEIVKLAAFVSEYHTLDGRSAAYVCRNFTCREPTTEIGEMLGQLAAEAVEK